MLCVYTYIYSLLPPPRKMILLLNDILNYTILNDISSYDTVIKLWKLRLQSELFFSFQTYSHEVYFDRDIVLHIEQKPNRKFSCYVYQMVCDTTKEDECSRRERTERVSCKKGGRIFEYT